VSDDDDWGNESPEFLAEVDRLELIIEDVLDRNHDERMLVEGRCCNNNDATITALLDLAMKKIISMATDGLLPARKGRETAEEELQYREEQFARGMKTMREMVAKYFFASERPR
jgi:hypothetical protein